MTDLAIVFRSLRARRLSTIITALTVAIAVALLMVLLTLRSAAARAFERGSGNAHLLVSADSSPLTTVLNALFYAAPPQRPISLAKADQIRGLFPFEWVLPTQQGDSYRGHPTLAIDPIFFEKFEPVVGEPWRFVAGRPLRRVGPDQPFEVVVGATVAQESSLGLGDRVHLTHGSGSSREDHGHVHDEYAYEVVGVLEPTGTAHDRALFVDLESSWILHAHDRRERDGSLHPKEGDGAEADADHAHDQDSQHDEHDHHDHAHDDHDHDHEHDHDHDHALTTAADLIDDDRLVTGLLLRLPSRSGSGTPAALQQVHDMLRRDTTIMVANPAEEVRKLLSIVGNVDGLFLTMAVAVLVSSAIAIMLALYDGMTARRRQIAVLRVLGFSRGRLAGLVLTESALIGAMGAAVGVALSFVGLRLAAAFVEARVGLVLATSLDGRVALLVVGGAIALAALAGCLPALAAYRTPVWRSLRPLG